MLSSTNSVVRNSEVFDETKLISSMIGWKYTYPERALPNSAPALGAQKCCELSI